MSTGNSKNRSEGLPGKPEAVAETAPGAKKTGRVQFDERGNAIWEWAVTTGAFDREITTQRLKKLENGGLSLADDAPTPVDYMKPNPMGTVKGYNPYDSGQLEKAQQAKNKRDLRKLGDWLKLKKQAASNKDEE